jgi:effector protein LidA
MGIDKTLKGDPSLKISPELNTWLDSAIDDKANQMRFDPPSEEDLNPNSPINVGRFGFKTPTDLKVFLLSPAGEAKMGEIGAHLSEEKAKTEEQQFALQEEEKKHSSIKIYLLLWLMENDAKAENVLREQIDLINQKTIEQGKIPSPESKPKETSGLQEAFAHYDTTIKQHQEEYSKLEAQEARLGKRMENLVQQQKDLAGKYEIYNNSLEEFTKSSKTYEEMSAADLGNSIKDMEIELNEKTDKIFSLLETGDPADEVQARQLLHEQNALNMQIATLKDLLATKSGDKQFFDASGTPTDSQTDAMYVVNEGQKIVEKDGQYYLIKSDQQLDDLSAEEQSAAQDAFQGSLHELMSVKQAVKHTETLEHEFFSDEINKVSTQQQNCVEEKMKLDNQIKLMQSVRATLAQQPDDPNANLDTPKPMPVPSKSGKVVPVDPPPKCGVTFAQNFLPSFMNKKQCSKDDLDKKIESQAKNKRDKKQLRDFFQKALSMLGLGTIPPMAPLPFTTMQSLLTNMARFGANPYKPELTSMDSPLDNSLENAMENASKKNNPMPMQSPMNSPKPMPKPTPKVEPEKEEKPTFNPIPKPR